MIEKCRASIEYVRECCILMFTVSINYKDKEQVALLNPSLYPGNREACKAFNPTMIATQGTECLVTRECAQMLLYYNPITRFHPQSPRHVA
jgi:hypothetical protein